MGRSININDIDIEGFRREIEALGRSTKSKLGKKEVRHIIAQDWAHRLMWVIGIATSWIVINPLSIILLGVVKSNRWTMIGHHILHRAYDRVEGIPKYYTSTSFAKGWRRYIDWFDWMIPGAWAFEHNYLHHYHTGEIGDPDFPQKNVNTIRKAKLPKWMKYVYAFLLMATWRFVYYAPNTLFYHEMKKRSNKDLDNAMKFEEEHKKSFPGARIYSPFSVLGAKYWMKCILPYATFNFILLPLAFYPLGKIAVLMVFGNMVLAELFTNLHTFFTVVANHAGDDIPYFESRVSSKSEFYYRQVVGTVNFNGGNEFLDTIQGYMNYQIEHHLWPEMPMNRYRELQPKVEAICNKYGVEYKKESIWLRAKKLVDLMIGKTDMLPLETKLISN